MLVYQRVVLVALLVDLPQPDQPLDLQDLQGTAMLALAAADLRTTWRLAVLEGSWDGMGPMASPSPAETNIRSSNKMGWGTLPLSWDGLLNQH